MTEIDPTPDWMMSTSEQQVAITDGIALSQAKLVYPPSS